MSARSKEPDGFIAAEQIEQGADVLPAFAGQVRILLDEIAGILAGGLQQVRMGLKARDTEAGRPGLTRA